MEKIRIYMRNNALVVGFLTFIWGTFAIFTISFGYGLWDICLREAVLSELILPVLVLAAGPSQVIPSLKGVRYALRKSVWFLTLAASLPTLTLLLYALLGEPLLPLWPLRLLGICFLSLLIGFFEEGMFRGVVFNSLLSKMGGTRRGILQAVVLSSFFFGVIHIFPSLLDGTISDSSTLLQGILKTATTTFTGIFLAVIYLRTHSLWSVAIVHGLNDFFVFIPEYLYNQTLDTEYVASDPHVGLVLVVGYLVLLALYFPIVRTALKELEKVNVPQYGFFVEDWIPHDVSEPELLGSLWS